MRQAFLALSISLVMPIALQAATTCGPAKVGLVAEDDPVVWPRDIAPGEGLVIGVLANDRDYAGGTLSVTAFTPSGALAGQVVIEDGQSLRFTPASPQTYVPNQYISYTVTTSLGGSQTAKAYFVEDAQSLPPAITFQCQKAGLICYFTATPQLAAGVRSYDWRFREAWRSSTGVLTVGPDASTCNRSDWRGRSTLCTFPNVGGDGKARLLVTAAVNYLDGKRAQSLQTELAWTPVAPDLTWWWDHATTEVPNTGLSLVAKVECPTCNGCTGTNIVDSLAWNWGEAGAPNEVVWNATCGGPHLGDFPDDVEHSYADPGMYFVKGIVNRQGVPFIYPEPQGARGMWVEVVNAPPQVTLWTENLLSGSSLDLRATIFDDAFYWSGNTARSIKNVVFDYGDGETYIDQGPFTIRRLEPVISNGRRHGYKEKGRYVVSVTVTDYHDATTVVTKEINVTNVAPTAAFRFNCDGMRCEFDAAASVDPETSVRDYYWRYDGFLSATATPQFVRTFTTPGPHSISLSVKDSDGVESAEQFTREVNVRSTPSPELSYTALPKPCRLYDSRTTNNPAWGNEIIAGFGLIGAQSLAAQLAWNGCGAPAWSKAVVVNVTVVGPTAPGYLTLSDETRPNPQSNFDYFYPSAALNFDAATSPRSNTITIGYHQSGEVSAMFRMYTAAGVNPTVHYVVDLVGYYAPPECPPGANNCPCPSGFICSLAFNSVPQQRLLDTRLTGGLIAANSTRTLAVSGGGGFAATSFPAISTNVTVVPQGDGSITVHDGAMTWSQVNGAATMAYKNGLVHASSAIVPVSAATGSIAISTRTGAAHAMVETNGYFIRKENGLWPRGAKPTYFHPLTPCRAFDSRFPANGGSGKVVTGAPISIQISGNCGVPRTATAAVLYATAVLPEATGYLRMYGSSEPVPVSTVLNFNAGSLVGNTAVVALGAQQKDLKLDATLFSSDVMAGTDIVVDVYGYYAPTK